MSSRDGLYPNLSLKLVAWLALSVALFTLPTPCWSQTPADKPAKETEKHDIDFMWGVKIPVRDGVKLNATIYLPKPKRDALPRLPVIFTFTPYISDSYHKRAYYFAQNGYVFALVDVRGRGNSEGKFEPFVNEARDGADVVEWLAAQPWCSGKVTMWGGSYAGFDQWMALKEFPPHLATLAPAAAAHAGVDFPAFKNMFSSYEMQWLTLTSGLTPNGNIFAEQGFWIQKFTEMYVNHTPFRDLDKVIGNDATYFHKWVEHPTPDAYWSAMAFTPEEYRRVNIPILTITAAYDADQPGAMAYYRGHMSYGSSSAKERHYLIIGPWDHAGTRTPNREVAGLKFGEASMVDLDKLHKDWYDWTLKSGAKPDFLKKRVAYYVMGPGAEEWKYADSLEAISNRKQILYLSSEGGKAGDAFHSGQLSAQKPTKSSLPDRYVYDPLDTRPGMQLEQEEVKTYITDQRFALNLFGNGLVYHSEPFEEATEISGFLKFEAWMAMDVPDTDFQVDVYEIMPDGSSIALSSDQMRARYRNSPLKATLVKPGEINRYVFDSFTFFSRRVAKGSRLRLVLRSPNSIYLEKNYNSGGVVSDASGKDARTAHIIVYHDAQHPSALEIPVVK